MATKLREQDLAGKVVQTYLLLVCAAARQEVILNRDIAAALGVLPQGTGPYLDRVWWFCTDRSLPDLTLLAVQTGHSHPAPGKYNPATIADEQADVWGWAWEEYEPPSVVWWKAFDEDRFVESRKLASQIAIIATP